MRQQGANGRRPRGRHHGGGHNGGGGGGANGGGGSRPPGGGDNRPRSAASLRHQTFDSNCIDLRVRGNAWQVHEKYQALARDAQSAGDRVAAEHYLQHAEHYFRIIEVINEATAAEQVQHPQGQNNHGAQRHASAPPSAGASYSQQQPEIPPNYYGSGPAPVVAATQAGPASGADAGGNITPMPQTEAVVESRVAAPNPFFTAEDRDDQAGGGTEPILARR